MCSHDETDMGFGEENRELKSHFHHIVLNVLWMLLLSPEVMSNSLQPHEMQHARLPCPSPPPEVCSDSHTLSLWCYPTILPSVAPFSFCLPELAQTHVHWISDPIQRFHPQSSPSPPFNLSQHQGLFQWLTSSNQVAKVLELQFLHQSFQWIFKMDFL